MSVQARRAFPVRVEQVVRREAEKAASQAQAAAKQQKPSIPPRRPGRPKGSRNTPTAEVTRTPELSRITAMLDALLHLIAGLIPLPSLVLDGHFGNHNALQRARQSHLHLIAKLRYDAALSFPSAGPSAGRGPHRQDGDKVDDDDLPVPYLKATTGEGHMQTCRYQRQLLHKAFTQPWPVVIIAKTNLRTQARAHVLLFSSDLALASTSLVDS